MSTLENDIFFLKYVSFIYFCCNVLQIVAILISVYAFYKPICVNENMLYASCFTFFRVYHDEV